MPLILQIDFTLPIPSMMPVNIIFLIDTSFHPNKKYNSQNKIIPHHACNFRLVILLLFTQILMQYCEQKKK
jgi:hypothetical protein